MLTATVGAGCFGLAMNNKTDSSNAFFGAFGSVALDAIAGIALIIIASLAYYGIIPLDSTALFAVSMAACVESTILLLGVLGLPIAIISNSTAWSCCPREPKSE